MKTEYRMTVTATVSDGDTEWTETETYVIGGDLWYRDIRSDLASASIETAHRALTEARIANLHRCDHD